MATAGNSLESPIVIVSNRGPVTFQTSSDGERTTLIAKRGSGGLVAGLRPLLESGAATWVAAAMSDGDRLAARMADNRDATSSGSSEVALEDTSGLVQSLDLVELTDSEMTAYYDTISNETLWFIHHGLYDLVRSPNFNHDWWDAWHTYEAINQRFAHKIAEVAPQGANVLIQDYHLSLVGARLRDLRPDLRLVHFSHTPFAGPDMMRVLPDVARTRLLEGMASYDACGFHTHVWARNFTQCLHLFEINGALDENAVFVSTLSSDIDDIVHTSRSDACQNELVRINEAFADQILFVRVDRMELSKNIVRGFLAFDLMLESRPDLRGRVSFLACCYPSRENVAAYRRYRDEVTAAADITNARWGAGDWLPIHLETDDNYARSIAALRRYDVLVVNPIRDGLNLVAKEGPAINEEDGQLILSNQAGAWTELSSAAIEIHPFDIAATAKAMETAADMDKGTRSERATDLRALALARTPKDWLSEQIAAAR